MRRSYETSGAIPDGYGQVRTVVFGATGFIGRWVARRLCEAGATVVLVVRDRHAASDVLATHGIDGEMFEQDVRDTAAVQRLLRRIRPAVTFNLAGYGVDRTEQDPWTAEVLNARLVEAICSAMASTSPNGWPGQAVVHAGTAMEYGSAGGNLAETSVPNPTTMYGKSKLAGTEALARWSDSQNMRGLTGRLFSVYGPGESADRLLPTLVAGAVGGNPIPLTAGLHERDFVYVEDAAEALLRLGLTSGRIGQAVNIATGVLTPVKRFAEIAARALGIPHERLQFGALPTRAEEMSHGPVSTERLELLTGWRLSTLPEAGIARTLSFVNNGPVRNQHGVQQ